MGVRIGQDGFPACTLAPVGQGGIPGSRAFAANVPESPIAWLVMRHHA